MWFEWCLAQPRHGGRCLGSTPLEPGVWVGYAGDLLYDTSVWVSQEGFCSDVPEEKAFPPAGKALWFLLCCPRLVPSTSEDKKLLASHCHPLAVPGWCFFNHQPPVFEKVSISLLNY